MKACGAVFLCWCSAVSVFAELRLDNGTPVPFGAPVEPLAQRLDERAFEVERGRPGLDWNLATNTAVLEFDTGKLWRVTFKPAHRFEHPLQAFADDWKNFDPIGARKITQFMPNDEFMAYFQAWTERARAAGKRENTDYWVKHTPSDRLGDTLTITFAPRRRLVGTGEVTGDSWTFRFNGETDHRYHRERPLRSLKDVAAACDTFNTKLRAPDGNDAPVPTPPKADLARGGVILEDGTQLHFGQAKAEVEKLTGVSATDVAQLGARDGIDQRLVLKPLTVYFDTDRLVRIAYTRIPEKLTPFPEPWKNFPRIGGHAIKPGITPEEFAAYLERWEKRAAEAERIRGKHFQVRERTTGRTRTITISMQPSHVAANGTVTPDLWRVIFTERGEPPNRFWRLATLDASRGEFSTRPLSAVAQNLKELKKAPPVSLPPIEPPKLELPKLEP